MSCMLSQDLETFPQALECSTAGNSYHQLHPLDAHQQTAPTLPHHHPMPHHYLGNHHQLHHHHHHHLLSVPPPRIERHASEPAPTITPTSPHLLTVPMTTAHLMKQHSDPVLPNQHYSSTSGSNFFSTLHRQYSIPFSCNSALGSANTLPLTHHISLPDAIYGASSPPPAGSSQYLVPSQLNSTTNLTTATTTTITTTSAVPALHQNHNKQPLMLTHMSSSCSGLRSENLLLAVADAHAEEQLATQLSQRKSPSRYMTNKMRTSKSPSACATNPNSTSSSFEHLPTLHVRCDELQRSVSSPQTSREIVTLGNPRSSHCPVIRPGPALGCNFCWNTIDKHGRILRRKTKYHCPECQTNLCIVPCFQEYHERMNNDNTNSERAIVTATPTTCTTTMNTVTTGRSTNSLSSSSSSGGGGGGGGNTELSSNINVSKQTSNSSDETISLNLNRTNVERNLTKTETI